MQPNEMKQLLADYERFRRGIKLDADNKKAIKRLCDNFIDLWKRRKQQLNCNQDIADGQIKAYEFIKEVLTGRKKRKYGALKDKGYWLVQEQMEEMKDDKT